MRVGVARAPVDPSDFGLLGELSSQVREIPCLGRRLTAVQNLTPLALSSAEKSVTVLIHKETVTDISTPCISACVDKTAVGELGRNDGELVWRGRGRAGVDGGRQSDDMDTRRSRQVTNGAGRHRR